VAGDQEIALDVKTPGIDFNQASALQTAQGYQQGQQNLQKGQTQLQILQRQNAGEGIQFANQQIYNAAAHGIDSDAWDANFQDLVNKGVPGAEQFLHRYNPILQQRVLESYGAPAEGTKSQLATAAGPATGAAPADFDQMYRNASPAQLAQSLQKNNTVLNILSGIKDQPTLNAAHAQLAAMGIPGEQFLGKTYVPLVTPQQLSQLFNQTQQRAAYLQSRVAAAATGAPTPNPAPIAEAKIIGTDDIGRNIYGVPDPSAPGGFRRIDAGALTTGMPQSQTGTVSIEDAAKRIQPTENTTGNPAAANPRSTAVGNDQFTEKTWLDTIKGANLPWTEGLSDKQLLALRAVPGVDAAMTVELAKNNAQGLSQAGLPVTTATIALSHKFGLGDATKILNAPQTALLQDILPKKVIDANPELKGQTAGAYAQSLTQKVGNNPVDIGSNAQATTASALSPSAAPGAPPSGQDVTQLHGADYLKTLPPDRANIVQMIAEGRAPFPSGFIMKTPYGQWLTQAVGQYEPGFTAQTYQQRQKAYNDWYGGGKSQQTVKSLDQALSHTLGLVDNVEKLGNWPLGAVVNKPVNEAESAAGVETGYVPLRTNAHAVADELGKIWKGANLSDTEIKSWAEGFRLNGSVPQQKADVAELMKLVNGGIDALEDQRRTSFGPLADTLPPVVSPEIQAKLDAIKGWATGKPAAPQVDQRDAIALRANSHNPAAAAAIDKKYGEGTAARLLGGQ
jgi:hypothetical protein